VNHRNLVTTSHLSGGKPEWTSSDDHRHKEISMSDLAGTAGVIANVDGEDSYVRIQMLTNAGALDRQAAGCNRSADQDRRRRCW